MYKHEAREFAECCVYEIVNNEIHYLCICKEYRIAELIAYNFAAKDKQGDAYYVTSVDEPGTLTWGGGWYDCYQKDQDGIVRVHSLM